jgi:hypothetical protein
MVGKNERKSKGKGKGSAPTAHYGVRVSREVEMKIPVFPISKTVRGMSYCELVNVTGTSGVPGGYVFTANGLYDPNVTSTGHQPLGFDQMMLFYEQYTVLRSKIKVTAQGASAVLNTNVFLYLSPDTTVQSNSDLVLENGLAVFRTLSPVSTYGNIKEMDMFCDVRKYFGKKSDQLLLADSDMRGGATSNPVEQVYYTLAAQDFGRTSTVTAWFLVEILYDVIFYEPRKLGQS